MPLTCSNPCPSLAPPHAPHSQQPMSLTCTTPCPSLAAAMPLTHTTPCPSLEATDAPHLQQQPAPASSTHSASDAVDRGTDCSGSGGAARIEGREREGRQEGG
eukprot:2564190-Rhodomonas_salina.1